MANTNLTKNNIHTNILVTTLEKGKKKTSNKQSHGAVDSIINNLLLLSSTEPLLVNTLIEDLLANVAEHPKLPSNYTVIAKGSESANDMTAVLLKKWHERLVLMEKKEDCPDIATDFMHI